MKAYFITDKPNLSTIPWTDAYSLGTNASEVIKLRDRLYPAKHVVEVDMDDEDVLSAVVKASLHGFIKVKAKHLGICSKGV